LKLFRIFWNEFRKEALTTLGYKSQWLGEFCSLVLFYFFLDHLAGKQEQSISGYGLWFYSVLILGDASGKISSEMRLGTLEQIYLSPFSVITILFAKMITSVLRCGLLMLSLIGLLSMVHPAVLSPSFFLAALCITPGLFGLSLLLGGVTLLVKDASWIVNIVNNSTLFLSGVFLTLESFPEWLQILSAAIPTTQAVALIRQQDAHWMNWAGTILSSLIYLFLGFLCFYFCDRKAKRAGTLGHY
jgi:ABC-2 type transport system permease protein